MKFASVRSRKIIGGGALAVAGIALAIGPVGPGTPLAHAAGVPVAGQRHTSLPRMADTTSELWAGELARNATFSSVTASWTTPTLNCDSNHRTAYAWVGLGGWEGTALEQVGTMNWCYQGQPYYGVFAEFYSDDPIDVDNSNYPIDAGDSITASVRATDTPGEYRLTLKNTSNPWTYTTVGSSPEYPGDPGNGTAEVVVESADGGNVEYSPFTFTDISYGTDAASDLQRELVQGVLASGDKVATAAHVPGGVQVTYEGVGIIR